MAVTHKFILMVTQFQEEVDGKDTEAQLQHACKLRCDLAAGLGAAGHDENSLMFLADALDRLTKCVDSVGLEWLHGVAKSAQDPEAKARGVLCQPTPLLSSSIDSLSLSKDVGSIVSAEIGESFATLAPVMALYVKVCALNRNLVSVDIAAKCAIFCDKVEGQISEACSVFQESVSQLQALKNKYVQRG